MKNRISFLWATLVSIFLFAGAFSGSASAQPSAAQLKAIESKTAVSTVWQRPGTREWSSTYSKYVWNVWFNVKRKTDQPGVFVTVRGYASFDIVGGRYVYWRSFTNSNSYAGIPNPTEADFQALIKQFGPERMLDPHSQVLKVGDIESLKLAPDPKYEWHVMTSVSFTVVAVFTKKTGGFTDPPVRGEQTIRVRLYRDDPKSAWKNIVGMPESWRPL